MTPVAKISKKFGVESEVTLVLYDTFPDDFDPNTEPLIAEIDGLKVPLYCKSFDRIKQTRAQVMFEDLDTDRRVNEIIYKELSIDREREQNDDEFTLENLIGFEITANGKRGVVSDFFDCDVNPLFEFEIDGRRVLVPAVEDFICGIDFEKKSIKFRLPDGLLDL